MSFQTMRRLFSKTLIAIGTLYGLARGVIDLIGRSTVIDDAKLLSERLADVVALISNQPAFWFYLTSLAMVLIGVALLIPQERWRGWLSYFRPDVSQDPSADLKKRLYRFMLDYLAPACERQIEMARAQKKNDAAGDSSGTCLLEVEPSYKKLAALLYSSPPAELEYAEALDLVRNLEKNKYWDACQPNSIAAAASSDPKVRRSYASWIEAHNSMVTAYEAIKMEPEFRQLYRARLPSRWGGLIEEPKAAHVDELIEFFEEGVRARNRLIRATTDFHFEEERAHLVEWSDRVVAQMEPGVVNAAERSRFKTLGDFIASPMGSEPMTEGQMKIQTMWTEKLRRLRAIIDRIGS